MKKLGLIVLGVLAAATLNTSVLAADDGAAKKADGQARFTERFKKADTNNDGKLSLEEFKAAFPKDSEKRFAKADANKDGSVTPEELKAAHRQRPDKSAK